MPLPTSGSISLSQIQKEFKGESPAGLKEYYLNGSYVKHNSTGKIPSSGSNKLSNYYGTVAEAPKVPVDAVVGSWSDWGPCSKKCGGGVQERTRKVITPAKDGGKTPALVESRACNLHDCPDEVIMEETFKSAIHEVYDQNKTTWKGGDGRIWTWKRADGQNQANKFKAIPLAAEPYSGGNAHKRGMPKTHGGFEVASRGTGGSRWMVVTQVVIPKGVDNSKPMTVWFDVGYRSKVTSGRFSCHNLTTNKPCCDEVDTKGSIHSWTRRAVSLNAGTFASGQTIELRWSDQIVNDATGLQVGAISITAKTTG